MTKLKRVGVCGSRDYNDRELIWRKLDVYTFWFEDIEVVTGACPKGADKWAEEWAFDKRYKSLRFHPDWDAHGKTAGPIRNREIATYLAEHGGVLVAFWNGKSPGTENMIQEFLKLSPEKRLRVVRV